MKRIKKEMNSQELQELEEQIREKMSVFPNKTRRVAEYILGNSDGSFGCDGSIWG